MLRSNAFRATRGPELPDLGLLAQTGSSPGGKTASRQHAQRQPKPGKEAVFRADAAFAKSEVYEAPEERGVKYAIRVPANERLEPVINEFLTRPAGRPLHKPVYDHTLRK